MRCIHATRAMAPDACKYACKCEQCQQHPPDNPNAWFPAAVDAGCGGGADNADMPAMDGRMMRAEGYFARWLHAMHMACRGA